jgi:hypothetical protein
MAGQRVRRLYIGLCSFVLFLVLLQSKKSSFHHNDQHGKSLNSPLSEEEDQGRYNSNQAATRHILGLGEAYPSSPSREWKRNIRNYGGSTQALQMDQEAEEGANGSSYDTRRDAVESPHLQNTSIAQNDMSIVPMSQESEMGISTSETSSECKNINSHVGFPDSCSYVRANQQCEPGARIKYVEFFYCTCSHFPSLAYAIFLVWLAVLFYMLGNTAADYFCCTLEKLSKLLHLPPTVAGVTLLPLGNGAPDVFASIASFMGIGHGQVNTCFAVFFRVFKFPGASIRVLTIAVLLDVAGRAEQLTRRCNVCHLNSGRLSGSFGVKFSAGALNLP